MEQEVSISGIAKRHLPTVEQQQVFTHSQLCINIFFPDTGNSPGKQITKETFLPCPKEVHGLVGSKYES